MKLFKWHLIDDIELRCYENGYIREFKKRLEILEKEDFLKTKRLTERDFEIERLKNVIKRITEINNQKIKIINDIIEYMNNNVNANINHIYEILEGDKE